LAYQDKLRDRTRTLLEEGEGVTDIYPAQTGLHPLWILLPVAIGFGLMVAGLPWSGPVLLLGLVGLLLGVRRLFVVSTDRSLVIMTQSSVLTPYPGRLTARLPSDTPIGPFDDSGFLWVKAVGLSDALGSRVLLGRRVPQNRD